MAPSIISDFLRRLGRYERITSMSKIARRYFVMNAFDGSLTMFGLVIGSFFAGVENASLVFGVGISTAVAMGVSGMWGALFTERAERTSELKDLEKLMLRKLGGSYHGEASSAASYITATVNAFSPALAGFIMLSPFLLADQDMFGITTSLAYRLSLAISFGSFFLLGAFLGKISKENAFMYGLRMLFAGVTSALLIYALSTAGLVSAASA